ncbi:MAG: inositol monophosphatase [Chitinispirillaceae bacterium]|nr:inositol monophosphatase [Chitinispirillaceae bacterium]
MNNRKGALIGVKAMPDELKAAEAAAQKAGEVIRSLLGKTQVIEKGVNYNLVTGADTAAERTVIETIRKRFPTDAFLGEESAATTPLSAPRLWIIDPLDGTTNFAHGIPHFAVSIAFARAGEVECGVVHDPMRKELFCAQAGHGAWYNGEPIRVSAAPDLMKSVIGTGFYYERGPLMLRTLDSIRKLLSAGIQGIRRTGAASLDCCYVAGGRFDGYFEYRLSPWDFAAGMLIVNEAGGVCMDVDGVERGLMSQGMICSNGMIHEELCGMVGQPSSDA